MRPPEGMGTTNAPGHCSSSYTRIWKLIGGKDAPCRQPRRSPRVIDSMPLQPTVLWAQRADRLLLTIDLQSCKDPQIR